MTYSAFDQTRPDGLSSGAVTLEHVRENQAALRDMILLGAAPGWSFAPSGGTAEQPAQILMIRGTERLRTLLTWGSSGGSDGNVTQMVCGYSSNSGVTFETIGTFAVSYDANGNVVSGVWS